MNSSKEDINDITQQDIEIIEEAKRMASIPIDMDQEKVLEKYEDDLQIAKFTNFTETFKEDRIKLIGSALNRHTSLKAHFDLCESAD